MAKYIDQPRKNALRNTVCTTFKHCTFPSYVRIFSPVYNLFRTVLSGLCTTVSLPVVRPASATHQTAENAGSGTPNSSRCSILQCKCHHDHIIKADFFFPALGSLIFILLPQQYHESE